VHVALVVRKQLFEDPVKGFGRLGREAAGGDGVQDPADFRVAAVIVPGVVAVLAQHGFHLRGGEPEKMEIFRAHGLADFDVGPVQGADGQRPVQGELHVARPRGLGAGGGDLFAYVRGRNEFFGQGNPVVGGEGHLDVLGRALVGVYDLGHAQDEVDDGLGLEIARRGLAGEEIEPGNGRNQAVLGQAQIVVDDVQDV